MREPSRTTGGGEMPLAARRAGRHARARPVRRRGDRAGKRVASPREPRWRAGRGLARHSGRGQVAAGRKVLRRSAGRSCREGHGHGERPDAGDGWAGPGRTESPERAAARPGGDVGDAAGPPPRESGRAGRACGARRATRKAARRPTPARRWRPQGPWRSSARGRRGGGGRAGRRGAAGGRRGGPRAAGSRAAPALRCPLSGRPSAPCGVCRESASPARCWERAPGARAASARPSRWQRSARLSGTARGRCAGGAARGPERGAGAAGGADGQGPGAALRAQPAAAARGAQSQGAVRPVRAALPWPCRPAGSRRGPAHRKVAPSSPLSCKPLPSAPEDCLAQAPLSASRSLCDLNLPTKILR